MVRVVIVLVGAVVLLLAMVAEPSMAAEPELWLWGPGGNPANIERDVLWLDNPDFEGVLGSSEVMDQYDMWSEIATDFMLEMNATIRKVTWWGAYWNGYEGVPTGSGFNLRFYMDADCLPEDAPFLEYLLPGDDCCEALAAGGDQFSQFVYEYCLELPLDPGLYWFSAQMADHEFPPQWGRIQADRIQICDSAFRSPYFGYPEWISAFYGFYWPWEGSQMFEDVCEPTAVENAGWGAVKGLFR